MAEEKTEKKKRAEGARVRYASFVNRIPHHPGTVPNMHSASESEALSLTLAQVGGCPMLVVDRQVGDKTETTFVPLTNVAFMH